MKLAKGRSIALIMLALTLSLSGSAWAQTSTTGGISGVVKDPHGAVVPQARIIVNGPNLIRPQTTTTE